MGEITRHLQAALEILKRRRYLWQDRKMVREIMFTNGAHLYRKNGYKIISADQNLKEKLHLLQIVFHFARKL